MGSLISIGLKLIKPALIIYLFFIQYISLRCSIRFLRKADSFTLGISILSLAIILKLLLNIASFANFKIVKQYSWLSALFIVLIVDFFMLAIPSVCFLMRTRKTPNSPKGAESIIQFSENINTFLTCDFSILNQFQYNFLGSLLLYISLVSIAIIYFKYNYKKLQSEAN